MRNALRCSDRQAPAPLARGGRLWEGCGVKHLVFASFASALLGGMSGTGLMLWMTQNEAGPEPAAAMASVSEAELSRRLELVEQALAAGEPRERVVSTALASAGGEPAGTEPPVIDDAPASATGPVFGAALHDVAGTGNDARDGERAAARDEKRRRRDLDWVNELTMRLGLTPAQTERLLGIQSRLASELERQRPSSDPGSAIPRDRLRTARQAIRLQADRELRGVLAPRQQAAYDQLNDELKLYRPKADD